MDAATMINAIWGAAFLVVILLVVVSRRARGSGKGASPRRRRGGVGTGAAGLIYEWLSEDKQKAIDIIVEGQAEARRPEYPDGNLPDLEKPKR